MKKLYLGVVLACTMCFSQEDASHIIEFNPECILSTKSFKTLAIVKDYLQHLSEYMRVELAIRNIASLNQKDNQGHLEESSSEIAKYIKLLEEKILNNKEVLNTLGYYQALESRFEDDHDKIIFVQNFLKNIEIIGKRNLEKTKKKIMPRELDRFRKFNRRCKEPQKFNFERATISKKDES